MSHNPETRIQHKQHSIEENADLHLWNHVNDVESDRPVLDFIKHVERPIDHWAQFLRSQRHIQ